MDRALEASAEYVRWLRRLTDAISLRRVDFGAAFDAAGNTADLYQRDGMHPSRLAAASWRTPCFTTSTWSDSPKTDLRFLPFIQMLPGPNVSR